MQARIGVLTIGVDELERSLAFYRDGLALKSQGIVGTEFDHGAVVFFQRHGGLKLALWARDNIAHDSTVTRSRAESNRVQDWAKRFMELHKEHWRGWEGETEVRQLIQAPDSGAVHG